MDESDPEINFDGAGVCNHCRLFDADARLSWFQGVDGRRQLASILDRIRDAGGNGRYDSVLGLSGGVDSSYLALKLHEWRMRPLVIHVDAGWNSELAVANIQRVIEHCGFDLHTYVVNWEEMRDLQLAYLRAAVSNQDTPQDHVFFAGLYHFAVKNRLTTIFSGGNTATEGIFPNSWHGNAMDARSLRAIHGRFGRGRLRSYQTIGFVDYYLRYPFFKGLRTVRPLNYIPYNKAEAIAHLKATIGWKEYKRKHGESIFTKWFQNYYLPVKFGIDKRRPHLSSLIVSGQMAREVALRHLAEPLYDQRELEADIAFMIKKLRISSEEFNALMAAPAHRHADFPNNDTLLRAVQSLKGTYERLTGRRLRVYS